MKKQIASDEKIKIIFLTSGIGLGGVERVLLEYIKKINLNKFDIKIAFHSEKDKYFEEEIPKEIKYKYMQSLKIEQKIVELKNKNIIKRKLLREIYKKYNRYLMKKNYYSFSKDRDIIIDFKDGKYFKYLKNFSKKKKICWIHGNIEDIYNLKKEKNIVEKNFQKMQKIVCICNEMSKELKNIFPKINERNIETIYNPFDIKNIKMKSNIEKEKLTEEYILMVSRLDSKQKDFLTLIKAYKYYTTLTKDPVKLFILGEGKDRNIIENEIKFRKLDEKITLLGADKNPYSWIKKAKILVHSSNYEGLPTVLIEGLILGKIIVSSDCKTGPREILMNGKYGLLFPVGDYLTLGTMLEDLLSKNLEKYKEIEKNILEKESIERFSDEVIIKKVENMLEQVYLD